MYNKTIRLRLITLTETLIILDITKASSNNCVLSSTCQTSGLNSKDQHYLFKNKMNRGDLLLNETGMVGEVRAFSTTPERVYRIPP